MKKTICFLLTALLTLASLSFGQANALAAPAGPVKCAFNSSQFAGKIRECAYAGDGKLFVAADKLYLYDTATASVLPKRKRPCAPLRSRPLTRDIFSPAWEMTA